MLGYPDRALRLNNEKERTLAGAVTLSTSGLRWFSGVHEFDRGWEPPRPAQAGRRSERLGRDNGLPVLWAMLAPASHGLARSGKAARRRNCSAQGSIQAWGSGLAAGPAARAGKRILAEAMALTGDLDNALQLIDEAISQIERPGWKNAFPMPRSYASRAGCSRSKAISKGRTELSRLARLRAPPAAKSWELRTSISLPACGRARANARTRMTCLPRFTIGSPKVSTPRICRTPGHF